MRKPPDMTGIHDTFARMRELPDITGIRDTLARMRELPDMTGIHDTLARMRELPDMTRIKDTLAGMRELPDMSHLIPKYEDMLRGLTDFTGSYRELRNAAHEAADRLANGVDQSEPDESQCDIASDSGNILTTLESE